MILEDVRADNWRACTALEVEEPQQPFVAPVANYLALCAYGDSPWRPLAVRVGEEVVGFVMWGVDPADDSFWIGGLVIGRQHQRRGYGRAVVAGLLERAASDGTSRGGAELRPAQYGGSFALRKHGIHRDR